MDILNQKIGLCLSGGGSRGVVHLGVIKALEEANIFPDVISGTSMGAIVGAFYAEGYQPHDILKIMHDENLFKMLSFKGARLGLSTHAFLFDLLKQYIREDNFRHLKTPLHISVSNITEGVNEIHHQGPLFQSVVASATIPLVYQPVEIDGDLYVDGGFTCNMPARVLKDKCDFLIGSHVNYIEKGVELKGVKQILSRCYRMAIYNTLVQDKALCDLFIDPPESRQFKTFDFLKYKEVFEIGYHHAKESLCQVSHCNISR